MAPFKLKFRMGSSSRSTSQETEEPVQQPLLTRQSSICDSNTTINSEFTSMSSTNDQHNLLSNNEEPGYENPAIMRTITDARCYQNVHASNPSHSPNGDNGQCSHQCDGENHGNVATNDGNESRDNENLMNSTGCSGDPLCAGQNIEDINLVVSSSGVDSERYDSNDDVANCSSSMGDESTSDGAGWRTNDHPSQHDIQSTIDTIINNKSSKRIYKAVAKEWGITCKMSETCRCMDCQSNYFDCEYDENEQNKTDGGLGAGAPMFINGVMHGSACTII